MLTTKKRMFADALMRGQNKTQSAISGGYSPASAKYKGHELSKDKDVLAYIERVKKDNPRDDVATHSEPVPEKTETQKDDPPKLVKAESIDDPLLVMKRIMNDALYIDPKLALDAAAKLAPYVASKIGESGKKEAKNTAAKKAASAFSAMSPPKLVVNNSG